MDRKRRNLPPCGILWNGGGSEKPKIPTLKDIAGMGFIKNEIDLLCVVQGKRFLDNLNGLNLSSSEYGQFPAILKRDGKIHFDGEAYLYPATAARAVRRIAEGRSDPIPEKTGGWLYWHFRDDQTGRWRQIEELRKEAESRKNSNR